MSTSESSNPYESMNLLWAQVDERGVILFTMGEIFPNIIDIPWNMWDAILPHIAKQREEMEADIAAGKDVPPAPLRIPSKDEISLKDFFR